MERISLSRKIPLPLRQSGRASPNCSHSHSPKNGLHRGPGCAEDSRSRLSLFRLLFVSVGKRSHQQQHLWRGRTAVPTLWPSTLCLTHPFYLQPVIKGRERGCVSVWFFFIMISWFRSSLRSESS